MRIIVLVAVYAEFGSFGELLAVKVTASARNTLVLVGQLIVGVAMFERFRAKEHNARLAPFVISMTIAAALPLNRRVLSVKACFFCNVVSNVIVIVAIRAQLILLFSFEFCVTALTIAFEFCMRLNYRSGHQ